MAKYESRISLAIETSLLTMILINSSSTSSFNDIWINFQFSAIHGDKLKFDRSKGAIPLVDPESNRTRLERGIEISRNRPRAMTGYGRGVKSETPYIINNVRMHV